MPKEEKKSWKEMQRERQAKQQRSEEAYQKHKQEEKSRPQKSLKRKLIVEVSIITLIFALAFAAYGIWQYSEGQKPPTIGGSISGAPEASPSTGSAPNFSLTDINGTQISLSQFNGKVIGLHFMAVGCGGQINPINEYQLTQLSSACNSSCGKENATFLTVAVATCENSQLDVLRSTYGVTWTLGNDYSDGALEIVNSYVPFEIGDGTIVLIDKTFNIAEIYNEGVSASSLVNRIQQLSGA